MRLESSAKWRGWAALALIAFGLLLFFFVHDLPASDPARVAPGLFLFPGLFLARGWWVRRRTMQRSDYLARAVGKAVSGD